MVNDIGPVIDPLGLSRIAEYVGKDPRFTTADEAVAYLNTLTKNFGPHTPEQSDALNRPLVRHYPDGWGLHYDPGIAVSFNATPSIEVEAALWHAWEAMTARVLITRGVRSDVLSHETMAEMVRRGREVHAVELPDTGHAPSFLTAPQLAVVREFFQP